jgi:hypothetical protein
MAAESAMTDHSQAAVAQLVAEIDRTGFGVIPNFVAADELARMRAFVARAVQQAGGEYAGFAGPEAVAGSGLDELARSPRFLAMIREIYERGTGTKAPDQELYQVLRCLSGASVRRHSYLFHYDSYVVTVLIPIEIPTAGMTGDFLMLPNTRRIRRSYVANVVDKVMLDNPLSQVLLRTLTRTGLLRPVRIKMVPGNAYFFWGYRSVHTNEPCDPERIRATALFHFANPHGGVARV